MIPGSTPMAGRLLLLGLVAATADATVKSVPRRSRADGFSAAVFAREYLAQGFPVIVTDSLGRWAAVTNATGDITAAAERLARGTSTRVWSEGAEGKLPDTCEGKLGGEKLAANVVTYDGSKWAESGADGDALGHLHKRPYFLAPESLADGVQGGDGLVVERRGAATGAVESWEDVQCTCSFSIQVRSSLWRPLRLPPRHARPKPAPDTRPRAALRTPHPHSPPSAPDRAALTMP